MSPELIAVLVLVIGVPLNLLVTVLLWRAYRANPGVRVLRERLVVEVAVLLLVLVFGLIFINNDRLYPPFDTDATKLITRLTMLAIAVIPACYWLILYWRRK